MRLFTYLLLVMILAACSSQKPEDEGPPPYAQYEKVFQEMDSLLALENGQMWQRKLNGPILFVDPDTRILIANGNNLKGEFLKTGNVYVDTLPTSMNIANTAIDWEGMRWTMIMLPLPQNRFARNNLIMHELFHGIQPDIGFDELSEQSNDHLDTYQGRILLKLELEALRDALTAPDEDSARYHMSNALHFRMARQKDEAIKVAENSLEINEGLAEYTGSMLSGRNDQAMRDHFINAVDAFYSNPTFVRSFAYQTIPIYGFLLSLNQPRWHQRVTMETNLTDFLISTILADLEKGTPYESLARANDYGYNEILEIESAREERRLEQIATYKTMFLNEEALKITMTQNMNISFNPSNLVPLETYGTVYPTLRLTADWGILTVEKGALISANWSHVTVSVPLDISSKTVTGDGWTLELEEGWIADQTGVGTTLKKM